MQAFLFLESKIMFSRKDIIVLGMMIFALFLGAGNIIFPPMEGFSSGQHWMSASLGFVLTGVLMPFITLVVVAILGRGEELTKDLPKWAGTGFLVILYLTIGSTFAMPRITNVAYEMAWLPLGLTENNANVRFVFSLIFNLIAMGFMISPNTIISSVGKFMTPALLVLLIAVAITVFISPLSEIQAPSNAYENSHSLLIGLTSGYQTMDVLAAIAFGGIVARALSAKNVTKTKDIVKYTISAGFVSVILLAGLYFSLFYLGATSAAVAEGTTNGGQIFSRYVNILFGQAGIWIMAGIIVLASLTTLVGVTSASADYFAKFSSRFSYPFWIALFTAITITVSQYGLTDLLRITIPALLLIYPVAIVLVLLQFLRKKLPSIKFTYNSTLIVTVCFSLCDSLNNVKMLPESINSLLEHFPLSSEGMAWLVPTLVMLVASILIGKALRKTHS